MPTSLETFSKPPANRCRGLPARLDVVVTAKLLGFAEHDIPVLAAAGKLTPLGDPAERAKVVRGGRGHRVGGG